MDDNIIVSLYNDAETQAEHQYEKIKYICASFAILLIVALSFGILGFYGANWFSIFMVVAMTLIIIIIYILKFIINYM